MGVVGLENAPRENPGLRAAIEPGRMNGQGDSPGTRRSEGRKFGRIVIRNRRRRVVSGFADLRAKGSRPFSAHFDPRSETFVVGLSQAASLRPCVRMFAFRMTRLCHR